jgi:c(7)-type cytochrome triheme protein
MGALAAAAALLVAAAGEGDGPPGPVPAPVEVLGRVMMDAAAARAGVPAVTFDHWQHRASYTCRVCHVDLGFAMKAGETQVTAAANESGAYCGACHDGKRLHVGRPIVRACSGWPRTDAARGCTRCHTGPNRAPGPDYEEFKRSMPADAAGFIDWAAALRRGVVKPADELEGVSPKRPAIRVDRDVQIRALGTWMNGVTFSHRMHSVWIPCELCHPDIFPMSRREPVRYTMAAMREGRYCGACHVSVAFPLDGWSCARCHAGENGRAVR